MRKEFIPTLVLLMLASPANAQPSILDSLDALDDARVLEQLLYEECFDDYGNPKPVADPLGRTSCPQDPSDLSLEFPPNVEPTRLYRDFIISNISDFDVLRIEVTDLDEPLSEWQGTITLNPPLREDEERTILLSTESCNHSFSIVTSNNQYLEVPQIDTCKEKKLIVFTQRPPSPEPVQTPQPTQTPQTNGIPLPCLFFPRTCMGPGPWIN